LTKFIVNLNIMDESLVLWSEGIAAFRLPPCIQQLLRFIYPTIDWRNVSFFNRLPWWLPDTGQAATTLPSGNSKNIRVFVDGGKLANVSATVVPLGYPNDLSTICDVSNSTRLVTLLIHECVHVLQMQEESTSFDIGYVRGSTFFYLQCWACNGFVYNKNLPHEREAYNQGDKFTLCLNSLGLTNVNWCDACIQSGSTPNPIQLLQETKEGLSLIKTTSKRWTCCDSGAKAFAAGVLALAISIVLTFVSIFIAIGDAIAGIFNSTEDDLVREDIRTSTPANLAARSDAELIEMIRKLFDGPTGDDDERAVLRLISSLPCPRVRTLVNAFGIQNFLDEFQGEEYGQLQFMFLSCGLMNLSDLDDDGVRTLINTAGCAGLSGASILVLSELFLRLFDGFTGDEDESAINGIMTCLPTATIRNILRRSGTSWADFEYEMDGAEWTQFVAIMSDKGIHGQP
jgi:hypothetical protein